MKTNTLKTILTFSLSAILFVSALTPAALAAEEPASGENTEISASETGKNKQGKKSAAERGPKEKTTEPENAIGKDAAISKALADAGISADEAGEITVRVRKLEDSTVVYSVHYTKDGQRASACVDAMSGEILSTRTFTDRQSNGGHAQGRGGSPNGSDSSRGQHNSGRGQGKGSGKANQANEETA